MTAHTPSAFPLISICHFLEKYNAVQKNEGILPYDLQKYEGIILYNHKKMRESKSLSSKKMRESWST